MIGSVKVCSKTMYVYSISRLGHVSVSVPPNDVIDGVCVYRLARRYSMMFGERTVYIDSKAITTEVVI